MIEFFGLIGVAVATKQRSGYSSDCGNEDFGNYLCSFCYVMVVLMLISFIIRIFRMIFMYQASVRTTKKLESTVNMLLFMMMYNFLIVWLIVGNFLVYSENA